MTIEISDKLLRQLASNLSVASDKSIEQILDGLPEKKRTKLLKLIVFFRKRRENKLNR